MGIRHRGSKTLSHWSSVAAVSFPRWKHRGLVTSSASVYLSMKWGSYCHLEGMLSLLSVYLLSAQVGIQKCLPGKFIGDSVGLQSIFPDSTLCSCLESCWLVHDVG